MDDSNLIKLIVHYQQCLAKHSSKNNEEKILYYLSKLYKLPVTVEHLQETGVGRTVNALRRTSGDVGDAATSLVSKWKEMITANSDSNISSDTSSKSESNKSHKHSKDKYKENSSSSSHKQSDKKQKYEKEKSNSSLHNGHTRSKDEVKDKQYVSVDKKYKENNYKHKHSKQKYDSDDSDVEKIDYEKQSKNKNEEYHSESDNNEKIRDERHNQTHRSSRKMYSSSDSSASSKSKIVHVLSDSDDDTKSKNLKRKHSDNNLNEHSDRKTSKNSYNTSDSESDTKSKSPKRRHHSESDENDESKGYRKNSDYESDKELQDVKVKKYSSKSHTKRESSTEIKDRYKKEHKHKHKKEQKEYNSEQRSKKESYSKKKDETLHEDRNKSSSKRKHKEDKKSDSSSKHHHSRSSSHSKPKISLSENGIGSGSGTSFAEALGMLMPSSSKTSSNKKKITATPSADKPIIEVNDVSSDVTKSKALNLLIEKKVEPIDIDLSNLLPEITPNYRPLGNYSMDSACSKNKITTEDEALNAIMNSKISRTKVYSGNKIIWGKVPTLFEIATHVLQDNIDALEYTGGVPYTILKPVIDRATPDQLFMLEHHNPYLIEDTDELWKLHCRREFRNKQREEMETWRDMYMRCLDEREAKLKALTANIKQAQDKTLPVRQTKLAYVDSFVKPPRNIARKQAKHGTAGIEKKPLVTPSSRLTALATAGAAGQIAVPNPAPRSSSSAGSSTIPKMKKAPLMQKTLAFMKNRCFRR